MFEFNIFILILAKLEEEINSSTAVGVATKLTNQMFVLGPNSDETNLNSLNAATFISVVSDDSIYAVNILTTPSILFKHIKSF